MEIKSINHICKELQQCKKDNISIGVIVDTKTGDTRTMVLRGVYEAIIPGDDEIIVIFDKPTSEEEIISRIRRQLALHPPDRRKN